jgi:hypothetical protein
VIPEYEYELEHLWRRGVTRADAERLVRLADQAEHTRRAEFAAFAIVAEMIAGGTEALPEISSLSPSADPPARVLGLSARLWLAAARRRGPEALVALDELEQAMGELSGEPRATVARAVADLAIADTALVTLQPLVARRRLERVIRDRQVPDSLRVNARIALATRAMDATAEGKRAATILATAADVAGRNGFVIEAAHARLYGALVALMSGDATTQGRAKEWLDAIPPEAPEGYHALSAVVRAMSTRGDEAYVALADGVRRATERSDFVAYWLLLAFGARRYREDGDEVSAVATLLGGIAQLDAVDPTGTLARPLAARLEALRHELGQTESGALLVATRERMARDAAQR